MIIALVLFAFTVGFLLGIVALWLVNANDHAPVVLRAQKTISGVLPAVRFKETEAIPKLRPTGKLPAGEVTRMYHKGYQVEDLWLL